MKKMYVFILSLICFIFGFTAKISAIDYQGNYGYSYSSDATTFWFISDNSEFDEVYLNVETMDPIKISDPDYRYSEGVHFYTAGGDLKNKEYYYSVCKNSICKVVFDPLANGINITGEKNVIIANGEYQIEKWDSVSTVSTNEYNKTIYAIDAEKFAEKLVLKQNEQIPIDDSIFARISNPSQYSEDSTSSISVGYEYLEKSGMKYIEIGNLYDANNYFFPNQKFSSKTSNTKSIIELKNAILGFKNIKMNVIARVDFLHVDTVLAEVLKSYSSDYIVNGKINTNNSIMQRYLKDVYMYWINEYKIDGFYILDSQSYNQEYLKSLINVLKTESNNKNIFIYTDDGSATSYYTSNEIQNSLIGSLHNLESTGILSGNFSEENFNKLVNAMFSGYYNNYNNYKLVSNVINNIGDLNGLDLYSKVILFSGLGSAESVIFNKIRLAFLTVFASAGIPRVVAGNEYFNANSIPTDQVDSIESKVCMTNTKWCYAIEDSKTLDWGYLIKNGSNLSNISSYRLRYLYQYPNSYSMYKNESISYDKELIKSGLLYLTFNYDASRVGDYERSIMLVNYSDKDIELDAISDREYANLNGLIGKVNSSGDKTIVQKFTFFTISETKVNNIPNWVYIIVMVALLLLIFGIRALCIKLLKTKRGIDYNEYIKEQRIKNKKGKKKEKTREPSVFETYLSNDSLFKKKKKDKKKENSNVDNQSNKKEETNH